MIVILMILSGTAVAFAQTQQPTLGSDAVLRAGDVLRLRVWPDESMNGEFPIESSGSVHLPLIGELKAAGERLSVLQVRIRNLYGGAMKNPVISITPIFPVAVFGAVGSPGVYATEPTHTVMDVLARAGGLGARARADEIRIVREGSVIKFNAREALESGNSQPVMPRSGDRIVVPQRSSISLQGVLLVLQLAATGVVIANQLK